MQIKSKLQFLCLAIVLFFTATGYCAPPLRIAYPDFAPFHYKNGEGKLEGIFYDIITEALENRMGISVIWTSYPWARCQENVKIGQADAILTVSTKERGTYTTTHIHPFYRKPLNLFTYAGHARLDEIKKIRNISDIGTLDLSVITYSSNGWHKKYVEALGIRTFETSFLENVWKMLAYKRGDLVIEWPNSAAPQIKQFGLENQIIDTGVTVSSMLFHILIRPESEYVKRLDDFDKVIQKMRDDGTISAIDRRYQ